MTLLAKIAAGAVGIYALGLLGLYFGQRSLMYHPDRARITPASVGLQAVRERVLTAKDGTKLIAWQLKAREGKPTLLYFHGNAGNLSYRAERFARFQALGWGIFMLSYRGFGGSEGTPSELANISDAELSYQTLLNEGLRERDIVLYGESLGTGVATQIAVKHEPAGLILDAPFTSMVDAAAYHYPWAWVGPFIKDRYETDRHIKKLRCPVLILHGERDPIVPVHMGRALAKIAADAGVDVRLEVYPEGSHTDLYEYGALDRIITFVKNLPVRR